MKQGTSLGSQVGRWIILAALAAVLALLLTASLVRAQDDRTTVEYAENGTDPVVTLTATDPEGDTVGWSLAAGTRDNDDFEIGSSDGVLKFRSPPDYEGAADGDTDNTYVVEVTATDTAATPNEETFTVTVQVTNVDEPGKVRWTTAADGSTPDTPTLVQFEVGSLLTATASDGDISGNTKDFTVSGTPAGVSNVTWRWYRGGTQISGADAEDNTYTVTADDVGSRLRAEVTYRVEGNTNQETASLTSDYPVLATRTSNTAPSFTSTSLARQLNEGEKGMTVGGPVRATDDGSGALNYTLGGVDRGRFKIDQKTGQITTDVALDYDQTTPAGTDGGTESQCVERNSCVVTVTATDSASEDSSPVASVTINILNLNDEKPVFTTTGGAATSPTSITRNENLMALADTGSLVEVTYAATDPDGDQVTLSLMGADKDLFSLSSAGVLSFKAAPDYENPMDADTDNIYEVTIRASDGTLYEDRMVRVTVSDVNEAPTVSAGMTVSGPRSASIPENSLDAVDSYMASGPDADSATWRVGGADGGSFRISGGELSFASAPDFENPADADADNVYNVTVMAMAGDDMDSLEVEVTVTNANEGGSLTLSNDYPPLVGVAVTTMLTDPDGNMGNMPPIAADTVITGATWQWANGIAMDGDFTNIAGATSESYTPVADDAGMFLRVMATYSDAIDSGITLMATSAMAVAQLNITGMTSVEYAENGMAAVATYTASADSVTWDVSGDDAAAFSISEGGELSFNTSPDFENPADANTDNMYMVTVMANDGTNDAELAVTVTVTDVMDERPAAVQTYDADGDGSISIGELFAAIDDYFDDEIGITALFEVIDAYFG